jgi:hypothetical protein
MAASLTSALVRREAIDNEEVRFARNTILTKAWDLCDRGVNPDGDSKSAGIR